MCFASLGSVNNLCDIWHSSAHGGKLVGLKSLIKTYEFLFVEVYQLLTPS